LIIRKSRLFSQTEFSRRRQAEFLGQTRWFAAAEDIILVKLEWAKSGGSERQFDDAVSVANIQRNDLERVSLQRWAKELGVGELLERLFRSI